MVFRPRSTRPRPDGPHASATQPAARPPAAPTYSPPATPTPGNAAPSPKDGDHPTDPANTTDPTSTQLPDRESRLTCPIHANEPGPPTTNWPTTKPSHNCVAELDAFAAATEGPVTWWTCWNLRVDLDVVAGQPDRRVQAVQRRHVAARAQHRQAPRDGRPAGPTISSISIRIRLAGTSFTASSPLRRSGASGAKNPPQDQPVGWTSASAIDVAARPERSTSTACATSTSGPGSGSNRTRARSAAVSWTASTCGRGDSNPYVLSDTRT